MFHERFTRATPGIAALILTLGLLGLTVSPAMAVHGLVAAIGFDEGSGTTVADASGNAHNGTISGATWTTAGRFGNALSFNGANDWVTVNDTSLLDFSTGMTLEAWVRPASLSGWNVVVSKETTGGLAYALYASDDTSRSPATHINRAGTDGAVGTAPLPLDTWTHLAGTYDGSTLRVYVNGDLVGSRVVTGNITVETGPIRFGGNAIWGEFFAGLIDEIRIYNRALSQAEIQSDMIAPITSAVPDFSFVTAFGKGIFAHVVADGGTKERDRKLWEFWARDTAVAGTQLSYSWHVLEPQPGQYRWDIVRAHMAPWVKYGKKVWIELSSTRERAVGDQGLPGWVRSRISTVQVTNTFGEVVYPIFWDAEYQNHWFAFLDAFAREFDGDPGIEFISTGGYSPGHEPRGYGDDGELPDLLSQLQAHGYDGLGVNGVWHQNAFVPIVSYYAKIFSKTRIAQTLVYSKPYSAAMQELAGGRGLNYIFVNNGFSYKHATPKGRAANRERSLTYDADVGFSEFGRAGVGSLSFTELYRQAIGDPNNAAEYSRLSYLPLAAELLLPGNQEAIQTVQWATDNLRSWLPTAESP